MTEKIHKKKKFVGILQDQLLLLYYVPCLKIWNTL